MEAAISGQQTQEMQALSVQLVIPDAVQSSYTDEQQSWLWSVGEFIEFALRSERDAV